MDLTRPGAPEHRHETAARRAAHDRIVHDHDALPFQNPPDGVELEVDAKIPLHLLRRNERTPHVVVPDETQLEGDSRRLRKAERR